MDDMNKENFISPEGVDEVQEEPKKIDFDTPKSNQKYQFVDDPEPQKRPEDLEDKIIKHGSRIFNTVITVVGGAMLILFIYGIVLRLT